MVRLACVAHGTKYYERGRMVEDMGLKGLRVDEVMRYAQDGRLNPVYGLAGATNGRARRPTTSQARSPRP